MPGDDPTKVTDGGFDSQPVDGIGARDPRADRALSTPGTDGAHSFRVPFALYSAGAMISPRSRSGDPSIATVAPTALTSPAGDNGKYYMLTMQKAGSTTVTAKSNGTTATATISRSRPTRAGTVGQWVSNAIHDRPDTGDAALHAGAHPVAARTASTIPLRRSAASKTRR